MGRIHKNLQSGKDERVAAYILSASQIFHDLLQEQREGYKFLEGIS
jgi:hypothetical protein